MSVYYIFGALCSFGLALAAVILSKKAAEKKGAIGGKYDERQIAEQGRAYKIGFFTMLISSFIYGFTVTVLEWIWCEPLVGVLICICLSIAVWAGVCIWRDAYFRSADSPKAVKVLFGCMGLANIALGVGRILSGTIIENSVLGTGSVNLIVGLLLLTVCIIALLKGAKDKREAE